MKTVFVPVGLPGCGKTTYAEKLDGVIRVSSDDIREELFGDASVQYTENVARAAVGDEVIDRVKADDAPVDAARFMKNVCNNYVFNLMDRRTEGALRLGKSVYYDATNLTQINRAGIIAMFSDEFTRCVAVFFDVPTSVCLERNRTRARSVPDNVIRNMARRLDRPGKSEGFAEIITVNADGEEVSS